MIDYGKFFTIIRNNLFDGKMDPSQRSGIASILDEADRRHLLDDAVGQKKVAYMLATTKIETNATYQPVREAYWLSENWRKLNLRYYPYYGRGLPQLTWETNYRKMTNLLRDRFKAKYPDFDLVKNPDQALIPEIAIAVMFEGMLRADSGFGDYTGRALEDYFTETKSDWIGARYIVNGTDRAAEIGDVGKQFYAAFEGKDDMPARMLHYGMKGPDVLSLQTVLKARGYLDGAVDGDFGPATKNAVMTFQRSSGLPTDGIVGDQTRGKLGIA